MGAVAYLRDDTTDRRLIAGFCDVLVARGDTAITTTTAITSATRITRSPGSPERSGVQRVHGW